MLASSRMMGLCLYISPRHSKYSGGHTMCGPTGGMYSKCWLPIIKCTCRERSIPALPRGKTTHVALFKTCYKIYACPGRRGRRPLQIREKFGTKFAGVVSHSTGRVRCPHPTSNSSFLIPNFAFAQTPNSSLLTPN